MRHLNDWIEQAKFEVEAAEYDLGYTFSADMVRDLLRDNNFGIDQLNDFDLDTIAAAIRAERK